MNHTAGNQVPIQRDRSGFTRVIFQLIALVKGDQGSGSPKLIALDCGNFALRALPFVPLLAAMVVSAASAATGVFYNRAYFVNQQAQVATTLKEAEMLLARARRLLEGGATNDAAEAVVVASMMLDSADLALTGHAEKVAQLKTAPLSYSRREEQRRLSTGYVALVENYRLLDERATVIRGKDVGQAALVREYIRTRELSRAKLINGAATDMLLTELKSAAARSQRSDQGVVIVVTNEVRIVEKAMPLPVLQAVTNWSIQFKTITNTLTATNLIVVTNLQKIFVDRTKTNTIYVTQMVANASTMSTNATRPNTSRTVDALVSSKTTDSNVSLAPNEPAGHKNAINWGKSLLSARWVPRVGVLALMAFAILVVVWLGMGSESGGMHDVSLRIGNREETFDVEAGRDAVFLGKDIFRSDAASPHPWPKITIKRSAAILHPAGTATPENVTVIVNGAEVTTARQLHPGDGIELRLNGCPAQTFVFLGCAKTVPSVDETEILYAPKT